jgi:hypothetical protein
MPDRNSSPYDQAGYAPTWRHDLVRLRFEWCEVGVCLLLVALSVWFLLEARGLAEEYTDGSVGAATFPTAIAFLLVLAASGLVFRSAKRLVARAFEHPVEIRRPLSILAGIVLVALFPSAMETLGYYPTAAVWLVLFGYMASVRRPLHLGGLTAGFLLFTWVVFEKILGTPLP